MLTGNPVNKIIKNTFLRLKVIKIYIILFKIFI